MAEDDYKTEMEIVPKTRDDRKAQTAPEFTEILKRILADKQLSANLTNTNPAN